MEVSVVEAMVLSMAESIVVCMVDSMVLSEVFLSAFGEFEKEK